MPSWVNLHRGIAAAIVGAAVLGVFLGYRGLTRRAESFEAAAQRATAVNHVLQEAARRDSVRLDSLQRLAARHQHTIEIDSVLIVRVDSLTRPDSTCLPALAARDRLINDQKSLIRDLRDQLAVVSTQRDEYREAADTLQKALDVRPKRFTRFLGPNIGLGGAIGLDPIATLAGKPLALRVTVGLTINLGGIHL